MSEPDEEPRLPAAVPQDPPKKYASDEPPVVARLVVEIRSDGSRTIARGAIDDCSRGEAAAVQIEASTPAALVRELLRSMWTLPRFEPKLRPALGPSQPRGPWTRLAGKLNPFGKR